MTDRSRTALSVLIRAPRTLLIRWWFEEDNLVCTVLCTTHHSALHNYWDMGRLILLWHLVCFLLLRPSCVPHKEYSISPEVWKFIGNRLGLARYALFLFRALCVLQTYCGAQTRPEMWLTLWYDTNNTDVVVWKNCCWRCDWTWLLLTLWFGTEHDLSVCYYGIRPFAGVNCQTIQI